MRRDLGLQLAALRRAAGLTQHELAALTAFARSTVSMAEIGRQYQAREFWAACDKALDSGGVLTARADEISAVRDARDRAAALAAHQARQARALGTFTVVTSVQPCPHCGARVAVVTTLAAGTG
jgi:transcriptional regulator with XRE-family HTH domain